MTFDPFTPTLACSPPPTRIESFGAPYPNKLKLVVVGEDTMLFETNQVIT